MDKIETVQTNPDWTFRVRFSTGEEAIMDMNRYLAYEVFEPLKDIQEFSRIHNGGYFVEWDCGADLSADTIRAQAKKS